jgi:hypothetical protein
MTTPGSYCSSICSLKEMTPEVIDEVNSIEVAKGRVPGGGG